MKTKEASPAEKAPGESQREKKADAPGPTSGRGGSSHTVLLNDNVHTFDEVAGQVAKAIRCSYQKGFQIAHAVHNKGREIVYSGHLERCEAVAMVLEQIGLKVYIE